MLYMTEQNPPSDTNLSILPVSSVFPACKNASARGNSVTNCQVNPFCGQVDWPRLRLDLTGEQMNRVFPEERGRSIRQKELSNGMFLMEEPFGYITKFLYTLAKGYALINMLHPYRG